MNDNLREVNAEEIQREMSNSGLDFNNTESRLKFMSELRIPLSLALYKDDLATPWHLIMTYDRKHVVNKFHRRMEGDQFCAEHDLNLTNSQFTGDGDDW